MEDNHITNSLTFTREEESALMGVVRKLYSQPYRTYHNSDHLNDMLFAFHRYFRKENSTVKLSDELFLAILFHDAIYIPGNELNEQLSADVLPFVYQTALRRNIQTESMIRVKQLILATRIECHLTHDVELDYETKILLDLDLCAFSFNYNRFINKQEKIIQEYLGLIDNPDKESMRKKQAEFLMLFAALKPYRTKEMGFLNATAIDNITRFYNTTFFR